jgi:hypothetical protein
VATVPYYVYGMILSGNRTETDPFEADSYYLHPIPNASGNGSNMFSFGYIRAGKITIKQTFENEE